MPVLGWSVARVPPAGTWVVRYSRSGGRGPEPARAGPRDPAPAAAAGAVRPVHNGRGVVGARRPARGGGRAGPAHVPQRGGRGALRPAGRAASRPFHAGSGPFPARVRQPAAVLRGPWPGDPRRPATTAVPGQRGRFRYDPAGRGPLGDVASRPLTGAGFPRGLAVRFTVHFGH